LNPPTAQPIAPGIILPSQAEAAALQPTVTRDPPATVFSSAPVIRTTAGQPIAVTAPGLPPGTAFTVRIRQAGGTYATLASVTTDTRGNAVLPAFQASRPGTYRIALVDAVTGQVRYIKFVVKARR